MRLALSGVEEGEGLAAHLAITEPAESVCAGAKAGGHRIAQDAPQLAGPCSPDVFGWKGMLYWFRKVPHPHPEQCPSPQCGPGCSKNVPALNVHHTCQMWDKSRRPSTFGRLRGISANCRFRADYAAPAPRLKKRGGKTPFPPSLSDWTKFGQGSRRTPTFITTPSCASFSLSISGSMRRYSPDQVSRCTKNPSVH